MMKLSKISTLLFISLFALAGCNGEEENEGENGGNENGGTTENTNNGGDNGTVLKNYTLEFNIVNQGQSQETYLGWSVYITGNFESCYWGTFAELTYNEIVAGEQWRYTITFDEIDIGSYEYVLVYSPTGAPTYNHKLAAGEDNNTNLSVTIEKDHGDNYTNQIEYEIPWDDFWFADASWWTE